MSYYPPVYVYVIQASQGQIKIGCSIDPNARLLTIGNASPLPVRLVGFWRGNGVDEKALHERFKDSHSHNEWFLPTPAVLDFVKEAEAKSIHETFQFHELTSEQKKDRQRARLSASMRQAWATKKSRTAFRLLETEKGAS